MDSRFAPTISQNTSAASFSPSPLAAATAAAAAAAAACHIPHVFHPALTAHRPAVPSLPTHPITLPTAPAQAPNGPRASFRSWKWHGPAGVPDPASEPRPAMSAVSAGDLRLRRTLSARRGTPGGLARRVLRRDEAMSSLVRCVEPDLDDLVLQEDDHADDALLDAMEALGPANPATVTAVAAYRALAPFLRPGQRVALRTSISSSPPLQALAHVLRAAHRACAQQQRLQHQQQQHTSPQPQPPPPPPPQVPAQPLQQSQSQHLLAPHHQFEPATSSTITLATMTDDLTSCPDIPSSSDSAHSLWSLAPITGSSSSSSTMKMNGSVNGLGGLPRPIGHDDDLPWSSTVWTNDGRDIAWAPFSPSPTPSSSTPSASAPAPAPASAPTSSTPSLAGRSRRSPSFKNDNNINLNKYCFSNDDDDRGYTRQ